MPRPKSTSPRTEQILLRVTADEFEVLDAVGHLERQSVNAYVYGLIQSHVRSLRSNKFVNADLDNRRRYQTGSAQATQLFEDSTGEVAMTNSVDSSR